MSNRLVTSRFNQYGVNTVALYRVVLPGLEQLLGVKWIDMWVAP